MFSWELLSKAKQQGSHVYLLSCGALNQVAAAFLLLKRHVCLAVLLTDTQLLCCIFDKVAAQAVSDVVLNHCC